MKKILHTPEGVRDIYNKECGKKLALQDNLHKTLHLYGYHDIQTPMFEFFDVFGKDIGTIPSKELYKFFDREGNTLVLRPDITPSVARAAATLLETEDMPVKLCYIGNTFINHSSYQGRLKENTQLGAEYIGLESPEADAEMLAMVVDSLVNVGLSEFQVNIGHVNFFENLMSSAHLEEDTEAEVRELIINRNFFGVEEVLDQTDISKEVKEAFTMLPELVGGIEVLDMAEQYAFTVSAKDALNRLRCIYHILSLYGVENHISFDLSMSGTYGYYTGIIFRGYTFGTGDAVVRGGRYDQLVGKFGKQTPSIGFVIVVDELMNALTRQRIHIHVEGIHTLIVYDGVKSESAIALACNFRDSGRNVELLKKDSKKELEDYVAYGKSIVAVSLLYMREDNMYEMVNIKTSEHTIIEP